MESSHSKLLWMVCGNYQYSRQICLLWTRMCYVPDKTSSRLFSLLSQVIYLDQLLLCTDVLLRQCESDCGSVSLQLLQVLVTVQSLSTEPLTSNKVRKQKR